MAESTARPTRAQRPDSIRAEAAFRLSLEAMGATLLEPTWLGSGVPHQVRCAADHPCSPRPGSVRQGQGICRVCANCDPATAEASFHARLAKQGATLLDSVWKGSNSRYLVRCAVGHECTPRPGSLIRGGSACQVCAGRSSEAAWSAFRSAVEAQGGTVIERVWRGGNAPHAVVCVKGHDCSPHPASVVHGGQGICLTCAGQSPDVAAMAFRAGVAALGGTLLDQVWKGNKHSYAARCARGHDCQASPGNVRKGGGICSICSGVDKATAAAAFRASLDAVGAVMLEPYRGAHTPVRVLCARGHHCRPRPANVRIGHSVCGECAIREADALYVVRDEENDVVKIGITSGDPRPRLGVHARDGLDEVLRLHVGLPRGVAVELERTILAALRDAREEPVRGREYFHSRALALVLDLVDNHPDIRQFG